MKYKILLSLLLLVVVTGLSLAQTTDAPRNGAIITFEEKTFDFGDIKQGEKVEHAFKFKNTGTQPLVISDVVTTCACTAKQWSKAPVMPGKSGEVTVTFDSTGKQGVQNKVVTIMSNATNNPERVIIRVNVVPASSGNN